MVFSFFIFLLLLCALCSKKITDGNEQNITLNHIYNLIIGSVLTLLFLFPYWIFGAASAIGGYDEYHGQVTWFWLKDTYGQDTFLHSYFGGIGIKDSFNSGNEYFSLYNFLIQIFPQYIAGIFYKFLSLFITFCGLYFTSTKGFKLNRDISLLISIFILSLGYVNYQFSLGGNGMMIAILAMTYPILFLKKNKIEECILNSLFFLLILLCTNPLTFIPVFLFNYLAILIFIYEDKKVTKLKADFIFILFSCLVPLLNWYDSFVILFQITEESTRLQVGSVGSLYGVIKESIFEIYLFLRKEPHPVMFVILFLVFSRDLETRKKVIYSSLFIFLVPLLLQVISFLADIPLVRSYRWSQVYYVFEIFSGLILIYFISKNLKSVKFYTLGLILIPISAYAFSINTLNVLEIRDTQGGYNSRSEFKVLKTLSNKDKDHRVISLAYAPPPMIPLHYGLDTFDGAVTHASKRRTNFIEANILDGRKIHNHRQIFLDQSKLNLRGLALVNVKYILSSSPVSKDGLKLIDHQPMILFNFDSFPKILSDLFRKNFINKYLNSLYVYEIDYEIFPRFYTAKKIKISNVENQKNGIEELTDLKIGEVILNSKTPEKNLKFKENNNLEVIDYKLTNQGYIFDLEGKGLLVINNVYRDNWTFTCDEEEMKVYPVNNIMMGVLIAKECNQGIFTYDLGYE